MGDQETMVRTAKRHPTAHACSGARAIKVNGCITAEFMPRSVKGPVTLVAAPSELGRLKALAHESIHRPGIDEFIGLFTLRPYLRIALGDMNGLYFKARCQLGPFYPAYRFFYFHACIGGDIQQGLLDECRSKAGIGAVRQEGRRPFPFFTCESEGFFSQSVIGAQRHRDRPVGIAA